MALSPGSFAEERKTGRESEAERKSSTDSPIVAKNDKDLKIKMELNRICLTIKRASLSKEDALEAQKTSAHGDKTFVIPEPKTHVDQTEKLQDVLTAYKRGEPHFRKWLSTQDLLATTVSGTGYNCFINTLLQHATKKYNVSQFDDNIIRQIKSDAGIDPDIITMRYNDTLEARKILVAINKKYKVNLAANFIQIDDKGLHIVINTLSDATSKEENQSVIIWQQPSHYVGIISKSLQRLAFDKEQREKKDGKEILDVKGISNGDEEMRSASVTKDSDSTLSFSMDLSHNLIPSLGSSLDDISPHKGLSPPTIQAAIDSLDPSKKPGTFLMSHLLVTGFRGSEYQLLFLLLKAIRLLNDGEKSFAALVEGASFGNLDDVAFIIRQRKKGVNKTNSQKFIEAYQIKYYDHPISIYDFFNKKNNSKKEGRKSDKNEKMHIGKFFEGWLNWLEKYPDVPEENVSSILYTNASLCEMLISIKDGDEICKDFINGKTKICISHKDITPRISRSFLKNQKNAKISDDKSTEVWNVLAEEGYISKNTWGLTEKFAEDFRGSKLVLNKKNVLPKEISSDQVFEFLIKKHKRYEKELKECEKNRVDLYDLLYAEAWGYLNSKKYLNYLSKSSTEKNELFRRFLRSMRFKSEKPSLSELAVDVQKELFTYLDKLGKSSSSHQVYLCLFHAVHEWFCKKYPNKMAPMLVKKLWKDFIETSLVQVKELNIFQDLSARELSHIHCSIDERIILRPELNTIMQELNCVNQFLQSDKRLEKNSFILVTGEKGMGKSALAKKALESLDEECYLFLPAKDLVADRNHRESFLKVLEKIAMIRIVVIDAAESLLLLEEKLLKEFIVSLSKSRCKVILTITNDAFRHRCFQSVFRDAEHVKIPVGTLPLDKVKSTYSELWAPQSLQSLFSLRSETYFTANTSLMTQPFYLSILVKLRKRITSDFRFGSRNHVTEEELIKTLIEGQNPLLAKARYIAWLQLTNSMMKVAMGLNYRVTLPIQTAGLTSLVEDGLVISENDNYWFSHDLYFEYGMIAFWQQDWENSFTKLETRVFWNNIGSTLNKFGIKENLERWILRNLKLLDKDLIANANNITSGFFVMLLILGIKNKQDEFLEGLLKGRKKDLSKILNQVLPSSDDTLISTSIIVNNPNAVRLFLNYGARPHHPMVSLTFSDEEGNVLIQRKITMSHDENASEKSKAIDEDSESNSDSETSEHSGFGKNSSDCSDGEQDETIVEEEDPSKNVFEKFIDFGSPRKYWCANFDEGLDEHEEEWLWENNPGFELEPDNSHLYVHLATQLNRAECLEVLLLHYNKLKVYGMVSLSNDYRESPLHVGILKKSKKAVAVLLKYQADVSGSDCWEETPLHNAAYIRDVATAKKLLELGANPNAENEWGITPCHIAVVNLNIELVKLFLCYGGNISTIPKGLFRETEDIEEENYTAYLLKAVSQYQSGDRFNNFIYELIELLNYGSDDVNFVWGKLSSNEIEPSIRALQLKQVPSLIKLIKHCAKAELIAQYFKEKLEHAIEIKSYERLKDLFHYVLKNPDHIALVLTSNSFSGIRIRLLEEWLKNATETELDVLDKYANKYKDQECLKLLADEKAFVTKVLANFGASMETSEDEGDSLELQSAIDITKSSTPEPLLFNFNIKPTSKLKPLMSPVTESDSQSSSEKADSKGEQDLKNSKESRQSSKRKFDEMSHSVQKSKDKSEHEKDDEKSSKSSRTR